MPQKAMFQGVFGTGESQVLRHHQSHVITLDTRGLDLIDFSPNDEVLETVTKRSTRKVYQAFGRPIPPAYADDKDAAESAALEAMSRVCVARSTLVDPLPAAPCAEDGKPHGTPGA